METLLKILFFGLVPPLEGHSDDEKRWRLAVSFGLGAVIIAIAAGGVLLAGERDYATNDQLASLRKEVVASGTTNTALIYEMNIREFTRMQCEMRRAGNPDASAVWAERVADSLIKYEALTGRRYVLMGCEAM